MFSMLTNDTKNGQWLRQLLQSDECAASQETSCNNPGLAQTWAIIALFIILVGGAIGEHM